MKVFSTIMLTLFLMCAQNTAFAIVSHSNDQTTVTNNNWQKTAVAKQKKPNFVQKFVEKRMSKLAEKVKSELSQGDKLAQMGFWGVIGSIAASTVASLISGTAGIPQALSVILSLVSLAGLILCIVALTRDDLSAKGKKMAKWGIGICLALLALAVLVTIAVLVAFGV